MATNGRLSVVVVDDHPMFRDALRADLERDGLEVVAEAGTASEAVERALETRPALCLVDVNMPGGSGIAAAEQINRALAGTSVVLISAEVTAENVADALRAGAAGYLSKEIDPHRLPAVLRAVAAGESAFPRRELRSALRLLVAQPA